MTTEEHNQLKSKEAEDISLDVDVIKSSLDKGLVYGVVYAPMVKDTHDDWATADDIENAAHEFLPAAMMNDQHGPDVEKAEVVESYIAPCDFQLGNEEVIEGTWVLVTKVRDPELLGAITRGERTGYSLEGTAQKV